MVSRQSTTTQHAFTIILWLELRISPQYGDSIVKLGMPS